MSSKKVWEEYTPEEQTTLLNHWFYYYGGVVMTLKDLENFRNLSTTRQKDIFDHIVTSFIYQRTIKSNLLIACLREDKTEELFKQSLHRESFTEDLLEKYEHVRQEITEEIFNTFINPEPPVPMDIAIVIEDDHKPKKH